MQCVSYRVFLFLVSKSKIAQLLFLFLGQRQSRGGGTNIGLNGQWPCMGRIEVQPLYLILAGAWGFPKYKVPQSQPESCHC